CMQTLQPPYSF
nr:immunoglobulin light chain junction region [Macaca mulatta]